MPAIFMEHTEVPETKTVAQIQALLASKGAAAIMVEYDGGAVSSVAFQLQVGEQRVPFRLPCRWPELEKLLRKSGRRPRRKDTFAAWARRVAWRQILRWVEAQFALIETGMAKGEEVFLPYAILGEGKTMYEVVAATKFLALPAPEAK